MDKISTIYQKMIDNQYIFETKEYTDAINALICLDKETNCLDMLYGLAFSRNFANTFALSYILEHLSKDFLLSNRNDIVNMLYFSYGVGSPCRITHTVCGSPPCMKNKSH